MEQNIKDEADFPKSKEMRSVPLQLRLMLQECFSPEDLMQTRSDALEFSACSKLFVWQSLSALLCVSVLIAISVLVSVLGTGTLNGSIPHCQCTQAHLSEVMKASCNAARKKPFQIMVSATFLSRMQVC